MYKIEKDKSEKLIDCQTNITWNDRYEIKRFTLNEKSNTLIDCEHVKLLITEVTDKSHNSFQISHIHF